MIAIFPAIAAVAESRDIEELAVVVRKYHAVGRPSAVRLDVEGLVTAVGIPIGTTAMADFGAIACRDVGGRFDVAFMLREQAWGHWEKQFILAHLLGHYLLDVQPQLARGEWRTSGFREAVCPLTRYGQDSDGNRSGGVDQHREELADQFAGALLLPKAMVLRAMERLQDVKIVAEFFGVSIPCLTRRLEILMGAQPTAKATSFAHAERMIGHAEVIADPHRESHGDNLVSHLQTPDKAARVASSMTQKRVSQEYTAVSKKTTAIGGSQLHDGAKTKQADQSSSERALSRIRALAKRIDDTVG